MHCSISTVGFSRAILSWSLGLLLVVGAGCVHNESASSVELSGVTTLASTSGGLGLGKAVPMFFSDVYGLEVDWKSTPRTIKLETFEMELDLSDLNDPQIVDGPHRQERELSTSFPIYTVAARHANEIYVAGKGRGGVTIIERWVFPQQPLAFYSEKAAATPVIGVSVGIEPTFINIGEESSGGGSGGGGLAPPYSAPIGRPTPPPPIRDEMYRGFDIGPVESMAVDPEGRFLLLTTTTSSDLYQVVLSDPATVTSIFDPTSLSILNSDRVGLQVREHATEGRKYLLVGRNDDVLAPDMQLIGDAENDGVFETQSTHYANAAYRVSPYGQASSWSSNYRDYTYEP